MERDGRFVKDSSYREISDRDLYYDLEFSFSHEKQTSITSDRSIVLYLFFLSLVLNFIFNINQIITLGVIIVYGVLQQYFSKFFQTGEKIIGLFFMLIANIIDHNVADITVQPGSLTSGRLTTIVWLVEILWILLFGIEMLSLFAPIQERITPGRSVTPATPNAIDNYSGLKDRVDGSEYSITNFEKEVDTSLIQSTFRDLIKYLIATFIVIVLLDILIWEIVSIISGGNNIEEAYFVSGISFLIYVGIMIYSGNFFSDENSSDKN